MQAGDAFQCTGLGLGAGLVDVAAFEDVDRPRLAGRLEAAVRLEVARGGVDDLLRRQGCDFPIQLLFEDVHGQELCKIQEKMLRVRDTMAIEGPDGKQMAQVKKALITPLRDRWSMQIGDGPDLEIQGNLVDHEYTVSANSHKVAEISKKWFRVRDTYGVEIEPGQDDVLILAATVAVDMMN